MAWNYRKRVKVAPGVYVNISKTGVSTTVGVRGASVNFGKNGTYVNTGIPGTGFYQRQKLGGGRQPQHVGAPKSNAKKPAPAGMYIFAAILCLAAAVAFIVAIGGGVGWGVGVFFLLGVWANVSNYQTYYGKVDSVSKTPQYIEEAQRALSACNEPIKKKILQNFIDCYELLDKIEDEEGVIAKLKEKAEKNATYIEEHQKELDSLKEKLAEIQYDVDAELTGEERNAFENVCASFEEMIGSHKIWRITNKEQNSQVKASAGTLVLRVDGNAFVGVFNYLQSNYDIPVFDMGGQMLYLYPKFALLVTSPADFEVISYRTLILSVGTVRFQEEGARPDDAEVVDYTWRYVNKNGGPDKRFANNKQIPVMAYGDVRIVCPTKSVSFQFSNYKATSSFGLAYIQFERLANPIMSMPVAPSSTYVTNSIPKDCLDPMINEVAIFVAEQQNGSTSAVQRKFSIGCNRSGRIMDQLEAIGIVGPATGSAPRQVLVSSAADAIRKIDSYQPGAPAEVIPPTKLTVNEVLRRKPAPKKIAAGLPMEELNKLIGLSAVKTEVNNIYNLIKMQKMREEKGMKTTSISYHCERFRSLPNYATGAYRPHV